MNQDGVGESQRDVGLPSLHQVSNTSAFIAHLQIVRLGSA